MDFELDSNVLIGDLNDYSNYNEDDYYIDGDYAVNDGADNDYDDEDAWRVVARW